ncbi:bifunctional 4-hydroxy-2-oxoglutarate aldolase/2-dehydro-3-deoxy-phosphogluconate aldolase [Parapedobacter sp.]
MNHTELINQLGACRVVPVISLPHAESASRLAEVLVEGGLPVAEITFRTTVAAAAITAMRKASKPLLVGAGTLLNVDDVKKAIDAGAQFGVAPGLNTGVVEEALKLGFPFCPGVMTPSDVERGLSLGLRMLKFFPAEPAGGVPMLRSIIAPYKHTGVRFMPTGGISAVQAMEYLSIPEVVAVGGSWVASSADIKNENWNAILQHCKAVAEMDL